jgi:alkaline phosphatase
MRRISTCAAAFLFLLIVSASALANPNLRILLPERTRLLEDQRVDLVIEIREVVNVAQFRVVANGNDITAAFTLQQGVDLDCNNTPDKVYRAALYSFKNAGTVRLTASANANGTMLTDSRDIEIRSFSMPSNRRNVVLFVGDAMGGSYRDAARLVSRSVETRPGVPGMRGGFFDRLLEMDQMPVSGMVMTYASDRVVPDSANTATAWATGNKTFEGALNVFADGTDCAWNNGVNTMTLPFALDNPRIETLWEYLKRRYNYRTGIVSTAFITDATAAAEGAHSGSRIPTFEVARQYRENPFLGGQPAFDLILGGGKEDFDSDVRADRRNLISEFQKLGYEFISTRTQLAGVSQTTRKLLGLFRRPNDVETAVTGVRATANGNMDVAYDKLHLARPGSEPLPNFGTWTDQPFLDEMMRTAIQVLSGSGPFILLVEGGSIDKQSHSNHAAGVIWDSIELDKAVGVARKWAASRRNPDTLILVTGDHDQSMGILGVAQVSDADLTNRERPNDGRTNLRAGAPFEPVPSPDGFPDYQDANGDGYPENREVDGKGKIRLAVGFRTLNHLGTSVPITAEGPGAWLFTGYMDQTDIAFKIAVTLSGDTADGDALLDKVLSNTRYPKTYGKPGRPTGSSQLNAESPSEKEARSILQTGR